LEFRVHAVTHPTSLLHPLELREELLTLRKVFQRPEITRRPELRPQRLHRRRSVRLGDRLYTRSEVANCTSLKRTRVGEGYFVTVLTSFYNQRDELVGTSQYAFFRYR